MASEELFPIDIPQDEVEVEYSEVFEYTLTSTKLTLIFFIIIGAEFVVLFLGGEKIPFDIVWVIFATFGLFAVMHTKAKKDRRDDSIARLQAWMRSFHGLDLPIEDARRVIDVMAEKRRTTSDDNDRVYWANYGVDLLIHKDGRDEPARFVRTDKGTTTSKIRFEFGGYETKSGWDFVREEMAQAREEYLEKKRRGGSL